jgi:hypothetical protein
MDQEYMKSLSRNKIKNILFACILLFFSSFISILMGEVILRKYFQTHPAYDREAIRIKMSYTKLQQDIGFLWKENLFVSADENHEWYDKEKFSLITDEFGFPNPQSAIIMRHNRKPVDVIGLGDSFIHDVNFVFFNVFQQKGLFYYNMSMCGQGPPQYNIILGKYALPQKPKWVLYGLYENDFDDTMDFEQWKKSGLDWVTYHLWYRGAASSQLWQWKHFPGITELTQRIRKKYDLYSPVDEYPSGIEFTEEEKIKHVFTYITDAASLAKSNNINFLCILIPARDVNSQGLTPMDAHYEVLYKMLAMKDINVLDLRPVFRNYHGGRACLYNKIDSHWNRKGVMVASEKILEKISGPGLRQHYPLSSNQSRFRLIFNSLSI